MGYEIEKQEGYYEIRLFGKGSTFEILKAVAELIRRDPRKKYPDIWIVAPEFQVPYVAYHGIVAALARVFTKFLISKRTAFVASDDAFQKAQLDIYQQEVCSVLPVDARVFLSRDEAIDWIKNPATRPQA